VTVSVKFWHDIEVLLTMQVDQMLWAVTAIVLSSYLKLTNDFQGFNSLWKKTWN